MKTIFAFSLALLLLTTAYTTGASGGEPRQPGLIATDPSNDWVIWFRDDLVFSFTIGPPTATAQYMIEFDNRESGRTKLFANIGVTVGGTLSDLDGNGTVDASNDAFENNDDPICFLWLPHRMIRGGGRHGCGNNQFSFEPREVGPDGIKYEFFDHQWFWSPRGLSLGENIVAPSDVPEKPEKYRRVSSGEHVYPTERPIAMEVPPDQSSEDTVWLLNIPSWINRETPVQWFDIIRQRSFLSLRTGSGKFVEISMSDDRTNVEVIFAGQVSFKTWNYEIANTGVSNKFNAPRRHRIRLMNNVYHDINGDGALDGYHKYGETDAVIRVGLDLIQVAACDWEQRTAESKDKPTKRFSFESGRWSEVIKEDRD